MKAITLLASFLLLGANYPIQLEPRSLLLKASWFATQHPLSSCRHRVYHSEFAFLAFSG